MGERDERGQAATEYLGVLILVVAIIAAVAQTNALGLLNRSVERDVDRVVHDPDAVSGLDLASSFPQQAPGPPGVDVPSGDIELATVRGITVHASIADQVEALLAAAERDGLRLSGWGYRSPERQIELRRQHCGTSHYAIYEMPSSQCSPPTAPPGRSMHERGLAIDFENCAARFTACYQWLASNAARFGLYNFPVEPWHWSTDGT